MSELSSDFKTRQQAEVPQPSSLAPIAPAVVARRRRLIRFGGLLTFVLGIGLSIVPGPKGSSHTLETVTERGVSTQVHKFAYSRPFGVPFVVGRVDYDEDGRDITRFESKTPEGVFGNFGVALAIVIAGAIALGRRRRRA